VTAPSEPAPADTLGALSAADRARLLVRVGRIVASDLELDEKLDRTADAIHEILGYPNVDLPLVEEGDPPMLVIRARGGRYKAIGRVDRMSVERGVMGAAVRTARTQRVDDVAADPRYVHPPSGFDVRAELAVPIVRAGRVLGVVNVEGPRPFADLDVEVLEFVAGHLGLALETARLVETTRRVAVLEERQRLARELHDSVTQLLFSANLLAESIAAAYERDAEEGRRRLERLRELVRQALAEMRALLKELAPKASGADFSSREFPPPAVALLYREGLIAVLAKELAALAHAGVETTLRAESYERQSRMREEVLLRVAQEALANAAKHAGARRVAVTLACAQEEVRLTVEDDGRGFDAQTRGRGLGLASMRDRLREQAGRLRVVSAPGAGTTVEAILPR
jgi:signal transduction histidine kinase